MRAVTPLIAEARLLLRATSGNDGYVNHLALEQMRDRLYAECKHEKLVTKVVAGGIAGGIGQIILPGIGLLLAPVTVNWMNQATNELFDNTYLPLIREYDNRLRPKEVR